MTKPPHEDLEALSKRLEERIASRASWQQISVLRRSTRGRFRELDKKVNWLITLAVILIILNVLSIAGLLNIWIE